MKLFWYFWYSAWMVWFAWRMKKLISARREFKKHGKAFDKAMESWKAADSKIKHQHCQEQCECALDKMKEIIRRS